MAKYRVIGRSVMVDNSTAALTQLNSELNDASFNISQETHDTTDLDSTAIGMVAGRYGWGLSLSGFVNSTTDNIFGPATQGTSVSKTVSFQRMDQVLWYTGEAFVDGDYAISGAQGAPDVFSVAFVGNGNLTRTSVAPS